MSRNASTDELYFITLTTVDWTDVFTRRQMTRNNNTRTLERSFLYSYDGFNRYTGETYAERDSVLAGPNPFNINIHGFDEYGITYDPNGNYQTLKRRSSTIGASAGSYKQIDSLVYTYNTASNGNQLQKVTDGTDSVHTSHGFRNLTDSTTNYAYDGNGNLIRDHFKGLAINYNVLNRTNTIQITTATGQYINYTYDADGNLIRKQENLSGTVQTTDYIDGFVYITPNGGTAALSYFPMPEGRVLGGTYTQEYIITDPQGNARISFRNVGNIAKVYQENSYYGTGLIMPNSPVSMPTTPNKKLYNGGSEWQNDYASGTNLPDYYQTFNRNYDAAIGRWVGVDPAAESAESMTSYQYAGNNAIVNNDPMGDLKRAPYEPVTPAGSQGTPDVSQYESFNGAVYGGSDDVSGGGGEDEGDYSAFWNAFLAQANIYLSSYTDATLDNQMMTSLHQRFNASGGDDYGIFSDAFYDVDNATAGIRAMGGVGDAIASANDGNSNGASADVNINNSNLTFNVVNPPKTVSMGQYGSINILTYDGYYNNGNMGVTIKLGLNNTTGFRNLQWVQVITTNYPSRPELKSPYYDHLPNNFTPFYLIGSDYKLLLNRDGYDFEFFDQPWRAQLGLNNGDDIYWKASLSLVAWTSYTTYYKLFTIHYGFTITNGIYGKIPMSFSTPPFFGPFSFNPISPRNGP